LVSVLHGNKYGLPGKFLIISDYYCSALLITLNFYI
jgi:hypothetical protein